MYERDASFLFPFLFHTVWRGLQTDALNFFFRGKVEVVVWCGDGGGGGGDDDDMVEWVRPCT